MPINLATLKTELQTDPAGLGLAPLVAAANDAGVAAVLNLVRTGAPYLIFRGVISAYEIVNNTDPTEWAALTAQEKQRYQTIVGAGQVDVSNANIRNAFASMFAAGTATRTALSAMGQRQGSRAEVLFGVGTAVTSTDVGGAR